MVPVLLEDEQAKKILRPITSSGLAAGNPVPREQRSLPRRHKEVTRAAPNLASAEPEIVEP
jgi:hypothetical protein